jgi:nitroimidazol reductase NimA-like FMN-containing flavoprotein (pyridoxamine 5'-phosphate oxidase superfamily)
MCLRQAFVCHIGFTSEDGQPYVIPTGYARDGDTLYFHGSVGSRMLRALESGARTRPQAHKSCILE